MRFLPDFRFLSISIIIVFFIILLLAITDVLDKVLILEQRVEQVTEVTHKQSTAADELEHLKVILNACIKGTRNTKGFFYMSTGQEIFVCEGGWTGMNLPRKGDKK